MQIDLPSFAALLTATFAVSILARFVLTSYGAAANSSRARETGRALEAVESTPAGTLEPRRNTGRYAVRRTAGSAAA